MGSAARSAGPAVRRRPNRHGHACRAASMGRQVQIALMADGLFEGPVTGRIGPLTRAALRSFQRARGLAVTGTVTTETLATMRIEGK